MKRRMFSAAIAIIMLLVIIPVGTLTASAASITQLPIKAYPRNLGKTYATNGTSWAGDYDLCTISAVASYVTATYPLDGGGTSPSRTFTTDKFLTNNGQVVKGACIANATAYRRSTGNATIGSINTQEDTTVWVLGTEGSGSSARTQVIYKVTGTNYYKAGWVSPSAVRPDGTPSTTAAASTFKAVYPVSSPNNNNAVTYYIGNSKSRYSSYFNVEHLAWDYGSNCGSAIYAIAGGTVKDIVYSSSSYGNRVIIESKAPNGTVFYTLYAHLSSISVANGAPISAGAPIATMGSSGNTGGFKHLHIAAWSGTYSSTPEQTGKMVDSAGTKATGSSGNRTFYSVAELVRRQNLW